jgi:hypothetical protein
MIRVFTGTVLQHNRHQANGYSFILLPSCNTLTLSQWLQLHIATILQHIDTNPHEPPGTLWLYIFSTLVTQDVRPMLAGTPQQPPTRHHSSLHRDVKSAAA